MKLRSEKEKTQWIMEIAIGSEHGEFTDTEQFHSPKEVGSG